MCSARSRSGVLGCAEQLRLGAPGEQFYDGVLGQAVPARWRSIVLSRSWLVVLVAARLDLHRNDRAEQAHGALRDGRLLAGQVPLRGSPTLERAPAGPGDQPVARWASATTSMITSSASAPFQYPERRSRPAWANPAFS